MVLVPKISPHPIRESRKHVIARHVRRFLDSRRRGQASLESWAQHVVDAWDYACFDLGGGRWSRVPDQWTRDKANGQTLRRMFKGEEDADRTEPTDAELDAVVLALCRDGYHACAAELTARWRGVYVPTPEDDCMAAGLGLSVVMRRTGDSLEAAARVFDDLVLDEHDKTEDIVRLRATLMATVSAIYSAIAPLDAELARREDCERPA